jgi:hypothetical protein
MNFNRRAFLASLAGTSLAARVSTQSAPDRGAFGAYDPECGTVGLTAKQLEVWHALHTPKMRKVLFSGGRACGKSHVAKAWADELCERKIEYLVAVPHWTYSGEWPRRNQRYEYVVNAADDLRGIDRFPYVIAECAHAMHPHEIAMLESLVSDGGTLLLTSLVSGVGLPWLRQEFPVIGMFSVTTVHGADKRHHVNAAMWDNPHLRIPEESLEQLTQGSEAK